MQIDGAENIICLENKTKLIYQLKFIEKIAYKNIVIYPYNYKPEEIFEAIKSEDCTKVIETLYGPLILGNILSSNIFVGMLFDFGVCEPQNYNDALFHYEKSGVKDNLFVNERIAYIKKLNIMTLERR